MFKKIVVGCVLVTLACPLVLVFSLGIRHLLIQNALNRHHKAWSELGIDDYRFVLEVNCWPCDYRGELISIVVQDGQPTSKSYSEDQVELEDNIFGGFDTIDELYMVIEDEVRGNFGIVPWTMLFSGQFNDEYHYPTKVSIHYLFFVDAGITYKVLGLEPLE
ncbi:MAG: hypothetical protein A2Z14_12545 [Chloroflexi bacterium RBG_16_48_8]|nr:MAG: hypothetical protein A2Z14_12545 [Chloroflexi bacterium RBG_16_48_8]